MRSIFVVRSPASVHQHTNLIGSKRMSLHRMNCIGLSLLLHLCLGIYTDTHSNVTVCC